MKRIFSCEITPWVAGLVIGLLAVLASTIGGLNQPDNYGFCTTCHAHDLILGLADKLNAKMFMPAGNVAYWPLLTTLGIVIGAWAASRTKTQPHKKNNSLPASAVIGWIVKGFLVMSFALFALGCPIRLVIRAANLNIEGWIGIGGVVLGIGLGVVWLKMRSSW